MCYLQILLQLIIQKNFKMENVIANSLSGGHYDSIDEAHNGLP